MQNNITENQAVISFAYNLKDVVKQNNWISRYDTDTDAFSFTVKRLPSDARLKYFGDEFAFYLTRNNQVKGIFIEYFKKNFLKHNQEIAAIRNLVNKMELEQRKEDDGSLLEVENTQLNQKVISGLENLLEKSLARGITLEPAG